MGCLFSKQRPLSERIHELFSASIGDLPQVISGNAVVGDVVLELKPGLNGNKELWLDVVNLLKNDVKCFTVEVHGSVAAHIWWKPSSGIFGSGQLGHHTSTNQDLYANVSCGNYTHDVLFNPEDIRFKPIRLPFQGTIPIGVPPSTDGVKYVKPSGITSSDELKSDEGKNQNVGKNGGWMSTKASKWLPRNYSERGVTVDLIPGSKARISHQIEFIAHGKRGERIILCEKEMEIFSTPVDPRSIRDVSNSGIVPIKTLGWSRGDVRLHCQCDKNVIHPFDTIAIKMQVTNDSSVDVKNVRGAIIAEVAFTIGGTRIVKRHLEVGWWDVKPCRAGETINETKIQHLELGSLWTTGWDSLTVKSSDKNASELFSVKYEIVMEVKTGYMSSDASVCVPVYAFRETDAATILRQNQAKDVYNKAIAHKDTTPKNYAKMYENKTQVEEEAELIPMAPVSVGDTKPEFIHSYTIGYTIPPPPSF